MCLRACTLDMFRVSRVVVHSVRRCTPLRGGFQVARAIINAVPAPPALPAGSERTPKVSVVSACFCGRVHDPLLRYAHVHGWERVVDSFRVIFFKLRTHDFRDMCQVSSGICGMKRLSRGHAQKTDARMRMQNTKRVLYSMA